MVRLQQNFLLRHPLHQNHYHTNVFCCQTLTCRNVSSSRGVEEEMRGAGERGAGERGAGKGGGASSSGGGRKEGGREET